MFVRNIRQGPDTVQLWIKFLPELFAEFILFEGATQSNFGINLRFLEYEIAHNFVELNYFPG